MLRTIGFGKGPRRRDSLSFAIHKVVTCVSSGVSKDTNNLFIPDLLWKADTFGKENNKGHVTFRKKK